MKTEVIMKRELFGCEISQKSKSGFFSSTDLVSAGNKWRVMNNKKLFHVNEWLRLESTREFIDVLEKEYGTIKINSKGKNLHTWVHPFLFIDMALAISPKLKLSVYSWLYDFLLKYRNDSGDSYKKMAGSIHINIKNKSNYIITLKETASTIKKSCGVEDWQTATEKQLETRDRIHENIALLCDVVRIDHAVELGIKKALEGK